MSNRRSKNASSWKGFPRKIGAPLSGHFIDSTVLLKNNVYFSLADSRIGVEFHLCGEDALAVSSAPLRTFNLKGPFQPPSPLTLRLVCGSDGSTIHTAFRLRPPTTADLKGLHLLTSWVEAPAPWVAPLTSASWRKVEPQK